MLDRFSVVLALPGALINRKAGRERYYWMMVEDSFQLASPGQRNSYVSRLISMTTAAYTERLWDPHRKSRESNFVLLDRRRPELSVSL